MRSSLLVLQTKLPTNFHCNRHSFMRGIQCIGWRNEEVARHRGNWEIKSTKKTKKSGNLTVAQQQIALEAKSSQRLMDGSCTATVPIVRSTA
jgi:hypothetical protein